MRSRLFPLIGAVLAGVLSAVAMLAGPVEFGMQELESAIAARGVSPRLFRFKTEVGDNPAESYRIIPGLITGGDLRGVMYGLLDAADQIRATGRVRKSQGTPALSIRGVRLVVKDLEGGPEWFHSRDDWTALFRTLARNRFNRFNLVLSNLEPFAAAGGPAKAPSEEAPERNLATLSFISQAAAEYAIDFTLGLNAPEAADSPQLFDGLAKVLSNCPAIRSMHLRMPSDAALHGVRAAQAAGRRIILEVAANATAVVAAAETAGVPVRLSAPYPGEVPALRQNRQFFWELGSLTKAESAESTGLVKKLLATGASGFEIDIDAGENGGKPDWAAASSPLGRLGYSPR